MMIWYKLARLIPYKLRYYVVINAGVDATTGEWGYVNTPEVKFFDVLDRMK